MIDLTPILSAAVVLVAAILTAFLIPLIKRRVDAEKLDNIREWVGIAVCAAEQIFRGSGLGAEKKSYVLGFLRDHGFTVDAEELDTLIEAAVLELKQQL